MLSTEGGGQYVRLHNATTVIILRQCAFQSANLKRCPYYFAGLNSSLYTMIQHMRNATIVMLSLYCVIDVILLLKVNLDFYSPEIPMKQRAWLSK